MDELQAEIGRARLTTCEEERLLLKAVNEKGRGCDEMKRLEKANMRFIVNVINQYKNRGLSLEELIEVAKSSLQNATESYDLYSDNKFIPYAVTQMRHSIEQAIAEEKP